MAGVIAKRIVLVFPTLFLVMIIAFFLSKWVPGDTADAMLLLQGIHHESSNYKGEYEKIYLKSGMDKPTFYLSLKPHFYPPNIHSIIDQTKRSQIKAFLQQKRHFNDIVPYIESRNLLINSIQNDTFAQDVKLQNGINNLSFISDINEIEAEIIQISGLINTNHRHTLNELENNFQKLKDNKISIFYPVIKWHGADNQFHQWFKNVIKGDFGLSTKDGRTVWSKISSAIKWSLVLIILNLLLTHIIAVPSGLYSGYRAEGWYDKVSHVIWVLLFAIPVFWLASMLVIYFTSARYGTWMNIFPLPGQWYIPEGQPFVQTLSQYSGQLILPVICLAANDIAQVSRVIRNNVVQQKNALYVRFARSKGLTDTKVLFRHILPNVLIPMITMIGGRIPAGLSGALVIEVIFNIPGMGRLMMDSINSYDWNVVFGVLLVVSFFTILFMTITDILYQWANPKIKTQFDSR